MHKLKDSWISSGALLILMSDQKDIILCTFVNVLDFWEGEERVVRKGIWSAYSETDFKIFQSTERSQAKHLSLQEAFRQQHSRQRLSDIITLFITSFTASAYNQLSLPYASECPGQ